MRTMSSAMEWEGGNGAHIGVGCRAGAQHAAPLRVAKDLLGAALANFFGNGQGLVDTRPDGGSAQIITGQPEAWETRASLCDCRQAVGVTEIVLR